MDREGAEDLIYESYLAAERLQKDKGIQTVRDPTLLEHVLSSFSGTPCAVVTGSKGKGSLCMMLSSILSTRTSVGMLTSPHITRFNERIRVGGEPIPDGDLVRIVSELEPHLKEVSDALPPGRYISPMGIQAAAALTYFSEKRTGFNVLECGKGAKYDDVARVPHRYALINSIFLEHTRELGPTLKDIAEDKSFVITEDTECAFSARQSPEAMEAIRKRSEALGVPLKVYEEDFCAESVHLTGNGTEFTAKIGDRRIPGLTVPLLGRHMAENAAMAAAAALTIRPELTDDEIRKALAGIVWPGRMEILHRGPLTILDACINRSSCGQVLDVMDSLGIGKADIIIGIPDDKDFAGVAETMSPRAERLILTRSSNPHYVFTDAQAAALEEKGIECIPSPDLESALARIGGDGPVVILGTTSLISDAERLFR